MNDTIGEKIKKTANILLFLNIIGCVILGIYLSIDSDELLWLLLCFLGPFARVIEWQLMYGFGQLIVNTSILVQKVGAIKNGKEYESKQTQKGKAPREQDRTVREKQKSRDDSTRFSTKNEGRLDTEGKPDVFEEDDEDIIECQCPNCKEILSFLKENEKEQVQCPYCFKTFQLQI